MSTLNERVRNDLKDAMRAKDEIRLRTIRSIITACTNEAVATGGTPQDVFDDEKVLAVIARLAKQRKDSIEQFKAGGREDLAENEAIELKVLEEYLPNMMEKDAIRPLVEAKIKELNITDKSGTGQLIGALMRDLKGKADGTDVKAVVEEILDK